MNNTCQNRVLIPPRCTESYPTHTIYPVFKRIFDVIFSLIGIVLLSLPMLLIAIAIRIDSPGSPIFRQKRVGQHGKLFSICKFRTMFTTAPSNIPTGGLANPEAHITPFGAFLRKSSLDELPQLFNILRGDMSFVGPRPLIAAEDDIHFLREAAGVYCVKPGMTGWAQINGRDCVSNYEKVTLDREYSESMSLAFDLKILLRTISVVANGEGYSEGCKTTEEPASTFKSDENQAA